MTTKLLIRGIALGLLGVVIVGAAPFVGMRMLGLGDIVHEGVDRQVFFSIRVPRVLLAFVAGACLACCGMVFQATFRNPLATPFTLGTSSGASFGAALTILTGVTGGFAGLTFTSVGAFIGALVAMAMVFGFASAQRVTSSLTLLLAGIAVSFLFSSLLMFAQFFSDLRHSFQIVRWLMGGLDVYGYSELWSVVPFAVPGLAIVALKLPELDLLLTGEDLAATRGVNVRRTKTLLFLATSLIVSSVVAVCGPIGFVGMMIPHICRLLVGAGHRMLGPASLFGGGVFLVICDTAARTLIAPTEIPVGVITALFGGPFFLWILFGSAKYGKGVFG